MMGRHRIQFYSAGRRKNLGCKSSINVVMGGVCLSQTHLHYECVNTVYACVILGSPSVPSNPV